MEGELYGARVHGVLDWTCEIMNDCVLLKTFGPRIGTDTTVNHSIQQTTSALSLGRKVY